MSLVFPGVYHESVVLDFTKGDIALRAHFRAQFASDTSPDGGFAVKMILASGVQLLNFVLEGGVFAGNCAGASPSCSPGVVIQGNVITGEISFTASLGVVRRNTVRAGGISVGHSVGTLVEGNVVSNGGI